MPRVTNKPFLLGVFMLNVFMLSVIILSVIMLSAIMLSVIMLDVIMLNVMAPKKFYKDDTRIVKPEDIMDPTTTETKRTNLLGAVYTCDCDYLEHNSQLKFIAIFVLTIYFDCVI
jgi:hypothetical protein